MRINNNFDSHSLISEAEEHKAIIKPQPTIIETFSNQTIINLKGSPSSLRQTELSIANSLQIDQLKKSLPLSTSKTTLKRNLIAPEKSVNFILSFNESLGLKTSDLKEKYQKMLESPFGLFRIMPSLFYKDITGEFASNAKLLNRTAPSIIINGDMHIENFGTFRGPDGNAVWGMNDFDQSGIGSPESDLERLATSAIFVARQASLGSEAEKELVSTITKKYIDTLKDISKGKESSTPFLSADKSKGAIKDLIENAGAEKRKDFLEKYTFVDSKEKYHFLNNDKLRPISSERTSILKSALKSYENQIGSNSGVAQPLKVLDLVEKLGSGGSSYGLPRYYALVANDDPAKAPIILEIKAILPSPIKTPDNTTGANGKEIVKNQDILSGYKNPLVGSLKMDNRSFLVRELEPEKNSYTIDNFETLSSAKQLFEQAAKVLARSHSNVESQTQEILNWIGNDDKKLNKRLTDFSIKYADPSQTISQALAKKLEG